MVDHRLSSRGVTEHPSIVSAQLSRLGIHQHSILPLDWSPVFRESLGKGKLQERTRDMRYAALFEACQKYEVPLLLTGHNLDDDIVTMFYRFSHLSGIDGLAAMKPATTFPVFDQPQANRFFVGHPLLPLPKSRLLATCEEAKLEWTRDESNEDLDYRRNSILAALRTAQEANPALTIESLQRTLNNFKRIRADVHDEIVKVFEKSVIVNKINGDCTLILNDAEWLGRKQIATRLITLLLQYGAANRYPARTPSVNTLYTSLIAAYEEHRKEQIKWLGRLPPTVREADLQPIDKTKRVGLRQHTLAGCTFYALSRVDAMRRIALQERLEGRKLEYGPAFLIQRDPPARISSQAPGLHGTAVTLTPGQNYFWDGRFNISYDHGLPTLRNPTPDPAPRTFTVSFMTPGDVKEFEALTRGNQAARRRVYAYMGTTPGTHLYQIPVVREVGSDYMAFPTLKADFPVGKYRWKTSYAGTPILVSRFLCLP